MKKPILKTTFVVSILLLQLLLLASCASAGTDSPTTVATTISTVSPSITSATTTDQTPVAKTTPIGTTTIQAPATSAPVTTKLDLNNCSGDEIVDFIKADGCPEEKLIYGFETEAGADTLAKIEDFLINTEANHVFSSFNGCQFYDVTEIDPYDILYNVNNGTPSKNEIADFIAVSGAAPEVVNIASNMTTAQFSEYYMTYLGLEFSDELKNRLLMPRYDGDQELTRAWYLEKYDTYYIGHGDSAKEVPESISKAYTNADGYVLALAKFSSVKFSDVAIILAPNGDRYHFVMSVNISSFS